MMTTTTKKLAPKKVHPKPQVFSVSMTQAGRRALDRLVEAEMPGLNSGRPRLSELVRAALAEYARSRGHVDEAALLEEA